MIIRLTKHELARAIEKYLIEEKQVGREVYADNLVVNYTDHAAKAEKQIGNFELEIEFDS